MWASLLTRYKKIFWKNFELIQNYQVLEHHHQRGRVSHHGPGPGGQEHVNLDISFKKSTPQTLYSIANAYHGGKNPF